MSVAAGSVEALQAAVRQGPRVLPHGAGTKPALCTPPDDAVALDVSGLSGILEYDPAELTCTALAGTPVAEVSAALAGDILRLCVRLGGSITGEHGVGVEKRDYLPLMFAEDDMALMRRVRSAVDPGELANRGKMLEATHAPDPHVGGEDEGPGTSPRAVPSEAASG